MRRNFENIDDVKKETSSCLVAAYESSKISLLVKYHHLTTQFVPVSDILGDEFNVDRYYIRGCVSMQTCTPCHCCASWLRKYRSEIARVLEILESKQSKILYGNHEQLMRFLCANDVVLRYNHIQNCYIFTSCLTREHLPSISVHFYSPHNNDENFLVYCSNSNEVAHSLYVGTSSTLLSNLRSYFRQNKPKTNSKGTKIPKLCQGVQHYYHQINSSNIHCFSKLKIDHCLKNIFHVDCTKFDLIRNICSGCQSLKLTLDAHFKGQNETPHVKTANNLLTFEELHQKCYKLRLKLDSALSKLKHQISVNEKMDYFLHPTGCNIQKAPTWFRFLSLVRKWNPLVSALFSADGAFGHFWVDQLEYALRQSTV